jgi:Immunoglobulin domain
MIWVPNQLVGAPAGTDVTIECHTEAYPRAISYWVYDSVMLLSTKKYVTSTTENSYRTHMKLTIRHLRDKDFGNYRCIAKNSLGETEGSIRLYGECMTNVICILNLVWNALMPMVYLTGVYKCLKVRFDANKLFQ